MATQGAVAPAPKKQPPAAASRDVALWPGGAAFFGDDFRRMVETFFGDPAARGLFDAPLGLRGWPPSRVESSPVPAVDVEEKPDEIVVRAEIPGLGRDDLNVSLMNGILTIRGEKSEEKTDENSAWHRRERRFGSFSRAIALPSDVEADHASAHFDKGVLEIRVPKSTEARRRTINVAIK